MLTGIDIITRREKQGVPVYLMEVTPVIFQTGICLKFPVGLVMVRPKGLRSGSLIEGGHFNF